MHAIEGFLEPIITVSLDERMTFLYKNQAYKELFDYHNVDDSQDFLSYFSSVLEEEFRVSYCKEIRHQLDKTGKFYQEVVLSDATGKEMTAVLRGILGPENDRAEYRELYITINVLDESIAYIQNLNEEREAFLALESYIHQLMFRLDIQTKHVSYYGNLASEFQLPHSEECFPTVFSKCVKFENNGDELFYTFIENLFSCGKEVSERIQLMNSRGESEWFQFEYSYIRDNKGEIKEAVGSIRNIETAKKAEYDELTECLRKTCFEEYASAYIANTGMESAVFIVDIDDFKIVNDNFGHQYGDMTLKNIGVGLRKLFRDSDYIGRIGGDEFMIFVKNISDIEIIQEKADGILDVLRSSHNELINGHRQSGSVGIAQFPKDGITFEEIYDRADQALYIAKELGKNQFAFYNKEKATGIKRIKTPLEMSQKTMSKHLDSELIADVFGMLFEANNFDASLNSVLRMIGDRFAVDRCYIFEPSDVEEDCYRNTYEWCAKGVVPQIEELQSIPHEMLVGSFFDEADEDGVFFCDNINALKEAEARELMDMQGIKSFLHSYIQGERLMIAVVGLDDCKDYRHWTPLEITSLMYVNKIIAQFLAYKRALHKISKDK